MLEKCLAGEKWRWSSDNVLQEQTSLDMAGHLPPQKLMMPSCVLPKH